MASGPAFRIRRRIPSDVVIIPNDGPYTGPSCECCYTPGKAPYCDRCIELGNAARREARKAAAR